VAPVHAGELGSGLYRQRLLHAASAEILGQRTPEPSFGSGHIARLGRPGVDRHATYGVA
jgi:hypothetical protein